MPVAKQIIAIDYGLKRIGVAIGNNLTGNAEPLKTLHNDDPNSIPSELVNIIKEWRPDKLIMGMPHNVDGTEAKMTKNIRRFAALLADLVDMPIEFIDESFSSLEATRQLKQMRQDGVRRKRVHKGDIDKAAAALMLQRWLDQEQNQQN